MKQVLVRISAVFVISFGVVWSPIILHAEQYRNDPCDLNRVPHRIQEILQKKFSSWRIFTLKDLSEEDQRFWKRSQKQNECPGIASGRYELDTASSFALSLVPRAGILKGYQLVIFHPAAKESYKEEVLEKYEGESNPIVIYTVPAGRYWNAEKNDSVEISKEGFQSEQRDKGAFLYFWKEKSLRQWTVSD